MPKKIEVGDSVVSYHGTKGIVRFIGILEGQGRKDSVWSEWGRYSFDGIISPCNMRGKLRHCNLGWLKIIKKGIKFDPLEVKKETRDKVFSDLGKEFNVG